MKNNTETALSTKHILFYGILSAALLSLFFFLIDKQFLDSEHHVCKSLIAALGEEAALKAHQKHSYDNNLTDQILFIGMTLLSSLGIWAGFKLNSTPRIIVCFQILALSLLLQLVLWESFHIGPHPFAYLMVIFAALGTGDILQQLAKANTENISRYYELKLRHRELQETRLGLIKQDEIERRILAADLHDQVLNDMKQLVQKFDYYVKNSDEDSKIKVLALSNKVMIEIREVMETLCPSVLEHLGLLAAMEDCLRKGGERANFKIRFRSKMDSEELQILSLVEQSLLFRLVQESITNICKHAKASIVRITAEKEMSELVININDDGIGLDFSSRPQESRGLKYMRLRADLIGAKIAWLPGDNNKGTKVEIRLDLSDKQRSKEND